MSGLAFELPRALEAREPPEVRGLRRDEVRLMVARHAAGTLEHVRFHELPRILDPGDLLVVNVSATLPAALDVSRSDGSAARVQFATRAPRLDACWRVVELRGAGGARPAPGRPGERLNLRDGAALELVTPYASGTRLMLARFDGPGTVEDHLAAYGAPIRYGCTSRAWPLAFYQTVYAREPGSAEMPSAGRPFTAELITALLARGVGIAPVTLHCGVSSPERHERPFPELFEVPEPTAARVRETRARGGRVIAVGTTVVRALESPGRSGWTNLVIGPERPLRLVDGLITGWHEPEASHLRLLEAVAGSGLLAQSYRAALAKGYLWHEFGDSHLILP